VLVTGCSRGIGRAVAIALAQSGTNVAVNFRTQEGGARVTCEGISFRGRKGILVRADVSQSAEVARLVATVEKDLGPIDILVNNAGIGRNQKIEETTELDWDEALQNNLKSVFLVTQSVLPEMRRRRWGRIVNISSGATQTGGMVGGIHYTASKAGMEGLTRAYATRLVKEGITVNAVAPVLIETDMTNMTEDKEGKWKKTRLGRLGQPEEVAEAVVFLAGNGYLTGHTIHLCGGLYFH
jgi:3-oxoacyl-[acyl-carrier protein] reductase